MRIVVQPEQLRQNAGLLRTSGELWRDQARKLRAALSGLDWETRHRYAVESQAQQAVAMAERLASQAEEKAAFLEGLAARFEQADTLGVQDVAQVSSALTKVSPAPQPLLGIWFALLQLPIGLTRLVPFPNIVEIFGKPTNLVRWIQDWLKGRPTPADTTPDIPKGKLAQVIREGLERARREQQPTSQGRVNQSIEITQQQPAIPTPVPLAEVDARLYADNCAYYAQARRPDLGPTGGQGGAADYIVKFRDKVFQLPKDASDLRRYLATGCAVVWDRGHPALAGTPGAQHGHVAIVEEVGPDYLVVSHTNWGNSFKMRLSLEQLIDWQLYFIP